MEWGRQQLEAALPLKALASCSISSQWVGPAHHLPGKQTLPQGLELRGSQHHLSRGA